MKAKGSSAATNLLLSFIAAHQRWLVAAVENHCPSGAPVLNEYGKPSQCDAMSPKCPPMSFCFATGKVQHGGLFYCCSVSGPAASSRPKPQLIEGTVPYKQFRENMSNAIQNAVNSGHGIRQMQPQWPSQHPFSSYNQPPTPGNNPHSGNNFGGYHPFGHNSFGGFQQQSSFPTYPQPPTPQSMPMPPTQSFFGQQSSSPSPYAPHPPPPPPPMYPPPNPYYPTSQRFPPPFSSSFSSQQNSAWPNQFNPNGPQTQSNPYAGPFTPFGAQNGFYNRSAYDYNSNSNFNPQQPFNSWGHSAPTPPTFQQPYIPQSPPMSFNNGGGPSWQSGGGFSPSMNQMSSFPSSPPMPSGPAPGIPWQPHQIGAQSYVPPANILGKSPRELYEPSPAQMLPFSNEPRPPPPPFNFASMPSPGYIPVSPFGQGYQMPPPNQQSPFPQLQPGSVNAGPNPSFAGGGSWQPSGPMGPPMQMPMHPPFFPPPAPSNNGPQKSAPPGSWQQPPAPLPFASASDQLEQRESPSMFQFGPPSRPSQPFADRPQPQQPSPQSSNSQYLRAAAEALNSAFNDVKSAIRMNFDPTGKRIVEPNHHFQTPPQASSSSPHQMFQASMPPTSPHLMAMQMTQPQPLGVDLHHHALPQSPQQTGANVQQFAESAPQFYAPSSQSPLLVPMSAMSQQPSTPMFQKTRTVSSAASGPGSASQVGPPGSYSFQQPVNYYPPPPAPPHFIKSGYPFLQLPSSDSNNGPFSARSMSNSASANNGFSVHHSTSQRISASESSIPDDNTNTNSNNDAMQQNYGNISRPESPEPVIERGPGGDCRLPHTKCTGLSFCFQGICACSPSMIATATGCEAPPPPTVPPPIILPAQSVAQPSPAVLVDQMLERDVRNNNNNNFVANINTNQNVVNEITVSDKQQQSVVAQPPTKHPWQEEWQEHLLKEQQKQTQLQHSLQQQFAIAAAEQPLPSSETDEGDDSERFLPEIKVMSTFQPEPSRLIIRRRRKQKRSSPLQLLSPLLLAEPSPVNLSKTARNAEGAKHPVGESAYTLKLKYAEKKQRTSSPQTMASAPLPSATATSTIATTTLPTSESLVGLF